MGRTKHPDVRDRRLIAVAAVLMQLALGGVHVWSVFRDPLVEAFGWTISEVTLAYTITNLTYGFIAVVGGLWVGRSGPRVVGVTAGLLYGLGVFLVSCADAGLWSLYLSYGLVAGLGFGLAFMVPVSTLIRWFPDHRGMATGLSVAGVGAGGLLAAPIATFLIQFAGVRATFAILGAIYVVMVAGAALLLRNPPPGYCPEGWQPLADADRGRRDYTLGEALRTWQWYAIWGLLFLAGTAGRGLLSQAAPMAQELTGVGVLAAGGMVGLLAVANGGGRFVWGWLSDWLGRRHTFLAFFVIQATAFALLPLIGSLELFTVLAFAVVLCFGGSLGTTPAFAADYYGPKHVGAIYGLLHSAGGFGGVVGPLLLATTRETTGSYTVALWAIAGLMVASIALPGLMHPPPALDDGPSSARDGVPALT